MSAVDRRELRRQKILLGAQDRMNILLGVGRTKHEHCQPEHDDPCEQDQSIQSAVESTEYQGQEQASKLQDTSHATILKHAEKDDNIIQPCDDNIIARSCIHAMNSDENDIHFPASHEVLPSVRRRGNVSVAELKKEPDKYVTNSISQAPVKASSVNDRRDDAKVDNNREERSKMSGDLDKSSLDRRLLCRSYLMLALGAIIRLTLAFDYFNFLPKSILLPFALLQVALYFIEKRSDTVVVERFSYLSALVLYGVSRPIIDSFRHVLTVTCLVFDDFTVYFFSFVLVHLFT